MRVPLASLISSNAGLLHSLRVGFGLKVHPTALLRWSIQEHKAARSPGFEQLLEERFAAPVRREINNLLEARSALIDAAEKSLPVERLWDFFTRLPDAFLENTQVLEGYTSAYANLLSTASTKGNADLLFDLSAIDVAWSELSNGVLVTRLLPLHPLRVARLLTEYHTKILDEAAPYFLPFREHILRTTGVGDLYSNSPLLFPSIYATKQSIEVGLRELSKTSLPVVLRVALVDVVPWVEIIEFFAGVLARLSSSPINVVVRFITSSQETKALISPPSDEDALALSQLCKDAFGGKISVRFELGSRGLDSLPESNFVVLSGICVAGPPLNKALTYGTGVCRYALDESQHLSFRSLSLSSLEAAYQIYLRASNAADAQVSLLKSIIRTKNTAVACRRDPLLSPKDATISRVAYGEHTAYIGEKLNEDNICLPWLSQNITTNDLLALKEFLDSITGGLPDTLILDLSPLLGEFVGVCVGLVLLLTPPQTTKGLASLHAVLIGPSRSNTLEESLKEVLSAFSLSNEIKPTLVDWLYSELERLGELSKWAEALHALSIGGGCLAVGDIKLSKWSLSTTREKTLKQDQQQKNSPIKLIKPKATTQIEEARPEPKPEEIQSTPKPPILSKDALFRAISASCAVSAVSNEREAACALIRRVLATRGTSYRYQLSKEAEVLLGPLLDKEKVEADFCDEVIQDLVDLGDLVLRRTTKRGPHQVELSSAAFLQISSRPVRFLLWGRAEQALPTSHKREVKIDGYTRYLQCKEGEEEKLRKELIFLGLSPLTLEGWSDTPAWRSPEETLEKCLGTNPVSTRQDLLSAYDVFDPCSPSRFFIGRFVTGRLGALLQRDRWAVAKKTDDFGALGYFLFRNVDERLAYQEIDHSQYLLASAACAARAAGGRKFRAQVSGDRLDLYFPKPHWLARALLLCQRLPTSSGALSSLRLAVPYREQILKLLRDSLFCDIDFTD